jgi:hypothetical protein
MAATACGDAVIALISTFASNSISRLSVIGIGRILLRG